MAMARSSKTLESVTKQITLNGTTLVQEEMRFGLADNEIGQLCMIDIEYEPVTGDVVDANRGIAISLDPDSNLNPLTDDVEDLEYICGMNVANQDAKIVGTCGKIIEFKDRVNFGTNLGLTVDANQAAVTGKFYVTVWFLRKKASSIELAKILLKRR